MASHRTLLATRRLLIADDEPFSRGFVVRMVREMGCDDILQAADGGETLRQLEVGGESLSAVVLDFNMPVTNGLQILKAIRLGKAGVPRDTSVLMLTGSSDFGLVGTAMSFDVDAFLIKPVAEPVLAGRFTKMFSETRELKSEAEYAAIDVEEISKRLLSVKPAPKAAGAAQRFSAARPLPPGSRQVRLEDVPPKSILADNVRAPDGELLLGAATVLSERILNRLKELQPALKLDFVTIFVTENAR